jgi:iron(III) transport system substrate-binding protein
MSSIRRRSFILGGSALMAVGTSRTALAQGTAATPHAKELYEAAKKEGGG